MNVHSLANSAPFTQVSAPVMQHPLAPTQPLPWVLVIVLVIVHSYPVFEISLRLAH